MATDRRRTLSVSAAVPVLLSVVLTTVSVPTRVVADQVPAKRVRRAWTMGTRLTVTVGAVHRVTALEATEAALRAVEKVENRLSTWGRGSELSRLNNAPPGTDVEISTELESDLRMVGRWWRETDGAFDPGIASLVEAWDIRGTGREPSTSELSRARKAAGFGHLALGLGTARREMEGFGIEEGGFGKGIALRQAVVAARAAGADCVMLDFGGQIVVDGGCGETWVGIADPDRRTRRLARLNLKSGSVATSGNSEHALLVGGILRGHLLDPRTGEPVSNWGTVTVVAEDPVAADCLSTALYVMGPEKGIEWLQGRPEIDAVFIESSAGLTEVTATAGLRGRLEVPGGNIGFLPPPHARIAENSN